MARAISIAHCIVRAIVSDPQGRPKRSLLRRILRWLALLFALYRVPLRKVHATTFSNLRKDAWLINDDRYVDSFHVQDSLDPATPLQSMDTMGYSGSTFFTTKDQAYLIKSVPRKFENSFFRDDLLGPYADYMAANKDSLLVRICDLLATASPSLGAALGLTPSHHIIMENLLYGQDEARRRGSDKWQTWDLKPTSYFFPERDIASGALTSTATKSRLADKFEDKIALTPEQADHFMKTLEKDTQILSDCNAVDYSLFLVRIKTETEDPFADQSVIPDDAPFVPPGPPSWRTGMPSSDGKFIFRAVILDFFWAKHKIQPRLMTLLISAYNILDKQGHMSITTTAVEYRSRFLEMCQSFVEVGE